MKIPKQDLDKMLSDSDHDQDVVERKIVKEKVDLRRTKQLAQERRRADKEKKL